MVEGLLLATPSAVRAVDEDERTALHWACSGSRVQAAALLLDQGAAPSACDDSNWTPMHIAASVGSDDIVKLLLGKGADLACKTESGRTAV